MQNGSRLAKVLCIALIVLISLMSSLPAGAAEGQTFTVNSVNDTDDSVCDAAHCSLREAINAANATSEKDTILFDIIGTSPYVIQPNPGLPTISQPVVIDGTSQPGFAGTPIIVLKGSSAGLSFGLRITSGNSEIRGLVISDFTYSGIYLQTGGSNWISGCYIGTNAVGDAPDGNRRHGIEIDSSSNNLIGGTSAADRNVISGNAGKGITISGASANGNVIQGNYIGTNANGTAAIANVGDGIFLTGNSNTLIGGSTNARNLISGNGQHGIFIRDAGSDTRVQGNYIGTDAAGSTAIGNGQDGISFSAVGGLIGGTGTGGQNIISGNGRNGIYIANTFGQSLNIQGNLIGTDATGMVDLGNGGHGVQLEAVLVTVDSNVVSGNNLTGISINTVVVGDTGNTVIGNKVGTDASGMSDLGNDSTGILIEIGKTVIGSTSPTERNVISGNGGDGIRLYGENAQWTVIQNNYIGVDAAGTGALGNDGRGVYLDDSVKNTTIGGTTSAAANIIAHNGSEGITIYPGTNPNTDNARWNQILGNSIFGNVGLGIDLNQDGVTANDAGDTDLGSNMRQNYPVITKVITNGTHILVNGTLHSSPSHTFRLEFFASPSCHISGSGEGAIYLGYHSAATGGAGNLVFTSTLAVPVPAGHAITATATNSNNDTSEFSVCSPAIAAPFADVSEAGKEWMQAWIEGFYAAGITQGCGFNSGGYRLYCPDREVTRAEMAVFIVRAIHHPNLPYSPTNPNDHFADVPVAGKEWMRPWIEEFYELGITQGCGQNPLVFCPERQVTRAEMAVFILRALEGGTYNPPPASHYFADVPVAGKEWMEAWIDEFKRRGITGGCGLNQSGQTIYCPERFVTRAEMAVFILRAFESIPNP